MKLILINQNSGDCFERLQNLPFQYEPFDFLRDKKLQNDYYEVLKEQSLNNQEIDFIIGNQFESFISESEFAKEIFQNLCQNDFLLSIFYKIIVSGQEIRNQRLFQEFIQFSLKYIHMFMYINKSNNNPSIKEKLNYLVQDSIFINNLQILKEEKELFKSIEKIENLLKEIRKQIQFEQGEQQMINEDEDLFNQNSLKQENDKNLFKQRAKEAQLKQLEIMRQKSLKFKESNLNDVTDDSLLGQDNEELMCLYCKDTTSNQLLIIQTYIQKDNLDLYSNKKYKIPHDNNFKYIAQSCQHTCHYDCIAQAKKRQKNI